MTDHTAQILRGIAVAEDNATVAKRLYAAADKYEQLTKKLEITERALDAYALQLANEDLLDEHHS